MNALPARFSFLYDVRALTIVNALFVVWAACTVVWLLRRHADKRLLLDLAAITALSALPRIAFFQKTSLRPNHFFRELALPPDAFSFDYPVAFPSLLRLINAVMRADLHELSWYTSLVVGSLTPAVFYLLALRLTQHRKLAWTVALLLAFNPAHVMLTGPHDFFITGVFFEVVSHLLLLLFFQTRRFVFFGGFLLASNLFYLSRPENSVVFYLHGLCVLYALWRLPVNKITLAAGAALFFGVNLAFQYDWYEAGKYQVHVVQNMWMAPAAWVLNFGDPTWNHLVDWRWCPPYLLPLLVLGTIRILRTRSVIHVYPLVIFATFFAIYSDIRCCTVHANARYFTNITPAVLLVAGEAIAWLYQRWDKTFPLVVAAIVAVFCAYIPRLADNQYITQYEWEFYWTQARHLVDGNRQVWMYDPEANHWAEYASAQSPSRVATAVVRRIFGVPETSTRDDRATLAFYEAEFAQAHLFDDGQWRITHRSAALAPGDYAFLGAHCYQFVVAGDRMLPECEQQLHDPRNEILAKASYPARFFHTAAPWVRSGAYRNFRTTTFYLLRRHA